MSTVRFIHDLKFEDLRRRRIEDAIDAIDRKPDALDVLMPAVLGAVREPARRKSSTRPVESGAPRRQISNLERIT